MINLLFLIKFTCRQPLLPSLLKLHIRTDSSEGLLGHDEVEIFEGDFVAVGGGTLKHLLKFVGAHGLTKLLGNAAQVVNIDVA